MYYLCNPWSKPMGFRVGSKEEVVWSIGEWFLVKGRSQRFPLVHIFAWNTWANGKLSFSMCITSPHNFLSVLLAPLRVVGKDWHSISSGGYWIPSTVLKVLKWSWGSLSSLNGSSWGNWNFDGIGHSRTAIVKGESVALTNLPRLRSVFSLMALLNLSISILISRRRSELCSSTGVVASFLDFVW